MKPKDALIAAGFPVKAGKGRLSAAAKAKLAELVASGVRVDGYSVAVVTPGQKADTSVVAGSAKNVVKDKPTGFVPLHYEVFWPEETHEAIDKDGKVWSLRNVCNNCRVSMVQCHCGQPSIFGDIGVTIRVKRR